MGNNILVYVESRDGQIQKVGFELLGEARRLATEGVLVKAVLVGNHLEEAVSALKARNVDEILVVEGEAYEHYNTLNYAAALEKVIRDEEPNIIFLGATSIGRDLGPRLSARLNCGLTADCTKLEVIDGLLNATRPAFGGNLMATIVCPNTRPQMATVRPGVFAAIGEGSCSKVIKVEGVVLPSVNVELVSEVKATRNVEAIEDAKVLVAVGRGAGSESNIEAAKELASSLGGTIASSRSLVDAGIMSNDRQVGQTGKTVKPELYIALGISGAIQHTVGMENSEFIVAVNKDKGATIFSVADLGVVGDVNAVLPLLLKRIKEEKAK